MNLPMCLTTSLTVLMALVGVVGILSTDFSKLFSFIVDFKIKRTFQHSLRLLPAGMALVGFLLLNSKSVNVGSVEVKVVDCNKSQTSSVASQTACSLCSLIAINK